MRRMNYYNDNDPDVCDVLRNLIAAGEIPAGDVDGRSITEVTPYDIKSYTQVHLFAGIAGWPAALALAEWPADRPVWSASCPCPPFSVAGKRQECPDCASQNLIWCPRRTGYAICADCGRAWMADARHLWPEVWRLTAERRPAVVFGEQVASPTGLDWLTGIRGSLEILGYAVGSSDLPAAGGGAPHKRSRLFWGARMGDANSNGREEGTCSSAAARHGRSAAPAGPAGCPVADAERPERRPINRPCGDTGGDSLPPGEEGPDLSRSDSENGALAAAEPGSDYWSEAVLIHCPRDGRYRRVPESSIFPLAHGLPLGLAALDPAQRRLAEVAGLASHASLKRAWRHRRIALRGAGNMIVRQIAAQFIRAVDASP